jgi:hypothetical protein
MKNTEGSIRTITPLSPERADRRHGKKRRAQHLSSLRKPVEAHRAPRPPTQPPTRGDKVLHHVSNSIESIGVHGINGDSTRLDSIVDSRPTARPGRSASCAAKPVDSIGYRRSITPWFDTEITPAAEWKADKSAAGRKSRMCDEERDSRVYRRTDLVQPRRKE